MDHVARGGHSSIRARARAHFVGRTVERERLDRALVASEDEAQVVLVRGEAGVGKTTLLRIFAWAAEDAGHRVVWISGEHVAPNPEAVTAHVASQLQTANPWSDLGTSTRPDVFVLDTAENLWPCIGWIFGDALGRAGRRVLVVVASRSAMPAKLRAQLGFAATSSELGMTPFTSVELSSAIAARGLPLALAAELERGCRGSPLAFALLAEHFTRTGALPIAHSAADPWMVLSQDFLRNATTEPQAAALRALSLSRAVDVELLAAMVGVEDALPLYRFLGELSFVDETPRGLVLHGVVRRSVFENLRATRPKELALYAERAIDVLSARAADSPLAAACDLFLEAFFTARQSNLARSYLFLEDMGCHSARHARDEDLGWIRACIERFEGEASCATFDALLGVQRDRLFVIVDGADEPRAVAFAVDLGGVPADIVAGDATLRLALERSRTRKVLVMRFWFARDTYQEFGREMTALMCSGPPMTMSLTPHSEVVFAVQEPPRWMPLAPLFGLQLVEGATAAFPSHEKGLFIADLDRMTDPTSSWRERHRQIFRLHARNLAELSAATPAVWPEHEDFVDAVREVLPVLRRRLELAESRLLHTALLTNVQDPASALVRIVQEGIDELGTSAGYAGDVEVLRATFLGPPEKHEAIAANLGVAFGTFRHRVRRATSRLAELLWRREVAARGWTDRSRDLQKERRGGRVDA
jgi:AAA ATPase domain